MSARSNCWKISTAIAALILGALLSRVMEPGVCVEKVTLAEETPALKFIPTGVGPHPVALLAHGFAASKETLFRYGEALAAAGFICYSVDQPGHGASPQKFTFVQAVHTLEAVEHEIGPVDVFAGWSMGGGTGGEAVREGGMRTKLFIAIGYPAVLGNPAPPLLLLAGRFEEAFPPRLLRTQTDARLVISPWSDHVLEGLDPVLVNAAVQASCDTQHKTPPSPPTAWLWRLFGVMLAMAAAGALASNLTDSLPWLARFRGLLIGGSVAATILLSLSGRGINLSANPLTYEIAVPVAILVAIMVHKLHIPRWSFVLLTLLIMITTVIWFDPTKSWSAFLVLICAEVLTPVLMVGIVIGWLAARRASPLQGNIAMTIFVALLAVQGIGRVRNAPQALTRHRVIKLDAKLLDSCVGAYEVMPDNVYGPGAKVIVRRKGDHLVWQAFQGPLDLYPESETNFFFKESDAQVTFIRDDKGEVTAIRRHKQGLPTSEGKRLSTE